MLSGKFQDVLHYNDDGEEKKEIQFRKFEMSKKTLQTFKSSGLCDEIDSYIQVEGNYQIEKIVGYGATSIVYRASQINDKGKQSSVAVKKIRDLFQSNIYAHRILREIKLMRILRGHKNVSCFTHLYIIYIPTYLFIMIIDYKAKDHHETNRPQRLQQS